MSETGSPPQLIQRLIDWTEEKGPELRAAGISLSHRRDSSEGTWAAWIEGESTQRLGSLTLWESGELDIQVLRRADDLLVLNEHQLIREPDELVDALEAFRLVLVYHDAREH
jgi:hypothetical protein